MQVRGPRGLVVGNVEKREEEIREKDHIDIIIKQSRLVVLVGGVQSEFGRGIWYYSDSHIRQPYSQTGSERHIRTASTSAFGPWHADGHQICVGSCILNAFTARC